jgi:hypothetical protein
MSSDEGEVLGKAGEKKNSRGRYSWGKDGGQFFWAAQRGGRGGCGRGRRTCVGLVIFLLGNTRASCLFCGGSQS